MHRKRFRARALALSCAGLTTACYQGIDPQRGGAQGTAGDTGAADDDGGDDGSDGAAAEDDSDPGRVTVHRLNNTEYDNTVRDLLGTTRRPAEGFTPDDYSYGFDNISEVLSMSPVQVELYHKAAHDLAVEAMREPIDPEAHTVEAETVGGTTGQVKGEAWAFMLPGQLDAAVDVSEPGVYAIEVRAWADQAGPEIARMEVSVEGEPVQTFEVEGTLEAPQVYTLEHELAAGSTSVTVAFVNDYHVPEQGLDRNLYVDWVKVSGPVGADGTNPIRDRILVCDPTGADQPTCVRQIVETFGRRAWRRPLEDAEIDAAVALFDLALDEGGNAYEGLELVVESFLASPKFLFRFEIDPDPTSLQPRALDGWELASRLSYFVWSSMPDDELFAAAEAGTLGDPDELSAQIDRMLDDPRASALVDNFAAQWLYLRGLDEHLLDPETFPDIDPSLLAAMRTETELYFTSFLESEQPLVRLLAAEVTYVDESLAAHYGIPAGGAGFQPVSLAGTERRGLLGQGSILTVTSHPDKTSPVKRGKWVLEQLLCSAPPPPPPGVEGVDPEGEATGSARDRLEQHVTDPSCAACHQAMDPIGFAMEHFDPVGRWRDMDGAWEIDASGSLPDGQTFDGAAELADVLAEDPRFPRCVAEKMMTYALGRGLGPQDGDALEDIEDELAASDGTLRDLVRLVAQSRPFLYRRGEPQ